MLGGADEDFQRDRRPVGRFRHDIDIGMAPALRLHARCACAAGDQSRTGAFAEQRLRTREGYRAFAHARRSEKQIGAANSSTGGSRDKLLDHGILAGDRTATIKLGDRYEISIDQNMASWHITDLCDGSKTCIWGDPHVVEGDGGQWDFKTASTFVLEDGTKITCNTVDPNGQAVTAPTNGVSLSGTLTITNGKDAIVVENVASGITSINGWGNIADAKLVVTQSRDGEAVDAAVDDGTVFNAGEGDSWLAGSTVVTSDLFNADGTLKGFDADAQTALALAASATASLTNDNDAAANDQVAA